MLLEMGIEEGDFLTRDDQRGHSREQDRKAVESLNADTSRRVSPVASCHPSGEEGEDSTSVGREPGEDVGTISIDAPKNSHVFSRFREGDEPAINVYRRDDLGVLHLHL